MSDPIPTGADSLDDLLGGGFERAAVTQLYGPPASGKSNVVLSAAIEVASAGGSALYIDTEGLSIQRLEQVAAGRVGRDQSVEDLASRVIISAAHTFEEQREAVQDAADLADELDLIVLDSATGFYRLERTTQAEGEALRDVARQITHLLSLARKYDLAVAFTNQVYTDPDADQARPLGGHTLEHWSAIVLRLERFRGGNRRARLVKHHAKAVGDTAKFRITGEGIGTPSQRQ